MVKTTLMVREIEDITEEISVDRIISSLRRDKEIVIVNWDDIYPLNISKYIPCITQTHRP